VGLAAFTEIRSVANAEDQLMMTLLQSASLPPYSHPSADQWLGSDALSQSFLPLLLKATAYTLADVATAASLALLIAIVIASLGSLFPGVFGKFTFNLASTFSFSTPLIAVLLLLYSIWGDHPAVFPLTVGCLLWGSAALTVQTAISQETRSDYIKAARSFGIGRKRLILVHVFPNLLSSLRAAWLANWPAMLSASVLTAYLGANGGSPRLGSLLKTGYELFPSCWWLWLPPTIITCVTFAAFFMIVERTAIGRPRA